MSKADLNAKYHSENWAARLSVCRFEQLQEQEWAPAAGRITILKSGRKYFDADENVIGVVFTYRQASGETTISVRMLREGGIVFHV